MKTWLIINGVVVVLGVLGVVFVPFLLIFIYYLWFACAIGNAVYAIFLLIKKSYKSGFTVIVLTLLLLIIEFSVAVLLVFPMMGHSVGE